MELKQITSQEDFIGLYSCLKELKYADITPATCLARCLADQYQGVVGFEGDIPTGIGIYQIDGDRCWVIALWQKNNLKGFPEYFYKALKKRGIKRIRYCAIGDEKAHEKITGMKRLWTVFGKEL